MKDYLRGGLFGKKYPMFSRYKFELEPEYLTLRMNLGIGSNLSRKPYWAYTNCKRFRILPSAERAT